MKRHRQFQSRRRTRRLLGWTRDEVAATVAEGKAKVAEDRERTKVGE